MSDLKCDMCGKEEVGRVETLYVKDMGERDEEGHLEGWLVLGPKCLNLMKSITDRNAWHPAKPHPDQKGAT